MSDRNKSSVGWSGFSGAGCPVLHLPSPESRPLPELQAPELTACVRTPGSPRPCVTFHALATIPALHHPSPVFSPCILARFWMRTEAAARAGSCPRDIRLDVPGTGGIPCLAWQHIHTSAPGAARCSFWERQLPWAERLRGCARSTGGQDPPEPGLPGPGCAFSPLLLHPGFSGCVAVDKVPWWGWIWGLFCHGVSFACVKGGAARSSPDSAGVLWECCRVPRGCSPCSQMMSPSPIPLKIPTAQTGLFQQVT